MILYDLKQNEGEFRFDSKEQALLELIVVSNAVLQILDTDGMSETELKELYIIVRKKYGVTLDYRLFKIANDIDVEAMDRLVQKVEGKGGIG